LGKYRHRCHGGLTIFVAGFRVVGGQPEINALPSTYYPTSLL
jgi:hypothetical protein